MALNLPPYTTRFIKPRKGMPAGSLFRFGAHIKLDNLREICNAIGSAATVGIVTEELQPVAELARVLVHKKTWALHNSIRIEVEEFSNSRIVIIVTAGDEVVYYAPYQEFGTDKHPPYPYLSPAWDTLGDGVKERIRSRIALMVKELRLA